jgi:hypothetical protein
MLGPYRVAEQSSQGDGRLFGEDSAQQHIVRLSVWGRKLSASRYHSPSAEETETVRVPVLFPVGGRDGNCPRPGIIPGWPVYRACPHHVLRWSHVLAAVVRAVAVPGMDLVKCAESLITISTPSRAGGFRLLTIPQTNINGSS